MEKRATATPRGLAYGGRSELREGDTNRFRGLAENKAAGEFVHEHDDVEDDTDEEYSTDPLDDHSQVVATPVTVRIPSANTFCIVFAIAHAP